MRTQYYTAATLDGFIATEEDSLDWLFALGDIEETTYPAFIAEAGPWFRNGELAYRETIVDGLENAPAAFAGLFEGANIGKMLVRVGPD